MAPNLCGISICTVLVLAGAASRASSKPAPTSPQASPAAASAAAAAPRYIACPGTPGTLAVWGAEAKVLAYGKSGDHMMPAVATGPLGKGRVVAFSHTGLLDSGSLATGSTREMLDGLLDLTLLVKHLGEQECRTGIVGDERKAPLERGLRLVESSGSIQHLAEARVGRCRVSVRKQGLSVRTLGACEI